MNLPPQQKSSKKVILQQEVILQILQLFHTLKKRTAVSFQLWSHNVTQCEESSGDLNPSRVPWVSPRKQHNTCHWNFMRSVRLFYFHLPILHSERDVSIRLQSAVQELWSPSGNTSVLFSRKAPMLNDKDQEDNVQNNPPALPACLVKWGLMTDCLSVLCFCLYSLS